MRTCECHNASKPLFRRRLNSGLIGCRASKVLLDSDLSTSRGPLQPCLKPQIRCLLPASRASRTMRDFLFDAPPCPDAVKIMTSFSVCFSRNIDKCDRYVQPAESSKVQGGPQKPSSRIELRQSPEQIEPEREGEAGGKKKGKQNKESNHDEKRPPA